MTKQLQERGRYSFGAGTSASRVELRIPEGVGFEAWEDIGGRLRELGEASKWWIGDWLAYGKWRYGDRYRVVLEVLGRSYAEVKDLAYVSGNVPAAVRVPELSWSHHREVAKLVPGEQERWLGRAKKGGWSVHELRGQLRDVAKLPTPDPDDDVTVLEQIRLTVPADRAARWNAAAERVSSTFEEWAGAVLDVAAAESEGAS